MTPEYKEFVCVRTQNGLLKIELVGGGEIPESLSGRFTSLRAAQEAVRQHLEEKQ